MIFLKPFNWHFLYVVNAYDRLHSCFHWGFQCRHLSFTFSFIFPSSVSLLFFSLQGAYCFFQLQSAENNPSSIVKSWASHTPHSCNAFCRDCMWLFRQLRNVFFFLIKEKEKPWDWHLLISCRILTFVDGLNFTLKEKEIQSSVLGIIFLKGQTSKLAENNKYVYFCPKEKQNLHPQIWASNGGIWLT